MRNMNPASLLMVSVLAILASLSVNGAENPPKDLETSNGVVDDESFYIFKDGQAMTSVIIRQVPGEDAHDVVKAAETFCEDIARGYDLDVRMGENESVPNRIELVVEDRGWKRDDEAMITFPRSDRMRITGGKYGVIRALFHILQEFGGVRYLFQGEMFDIGVGTCYPKLEALAVPLKPIKLDSSFKLGRCDGKTAKYYGPYPDTRRYYWKWEVRLNAKSALKFGHAMSGAGYIFPLDEYAKSAEKPDEKMFPTLRGKRFIPYEELQPKRYGHYWQPCFTSQASVDEAVKNILARLRNEPETKYLPLSVNDCGGHCECERCLEMDAVNGKTNSMGYRERSESYYAWVNQVAERVSKEFPDVVFGCIAYREVADAPTFKLRSNVVPVLCFDINSCLDPEVMEKRKKQLTEWSEKASALGWWLYESDLKYTLPRAFTSAHAKMFRFGRDIGVQCVFAEAGYSTVNEGPKFYVFFKMLTDPDRDPDTLEREWCEACVGQEAAPFLKDYFDFWKRFWSEKVVKTSWWRSRRGVYLKMNQFGSYMHGLEPGDMAHCRSLMENMLTAAEKSGTDRQIERAKLMMTVFEWYEAGAVACGAEFFKPDGSLPDAEAAVKLIENIPMAVKSYKRWRAILNNTKNAFFARKLILNRSDPNVVSDPLASAADFIDDPSVKKAMVDLSANKDLPENIRFIAAVMSGELDKAGARNMVPDGSFESGTADGWETTSDVHGELENVEGTASKGNRSLKCVVEHPNFTICKKVPGAKPHTGYFFSARIFIPEDQPSLEGRLQFWGNPCDKTKKTRGWPKLPELRLKSGAWNYVSSIVPSHRETAWVNLGIRLGGFEKGDVAYIDDVQLYEIPAK